MARESSNEHRRIMNMGAFNKIISIGHIEGVLVGGLPQGKKFIEKYGEVWCKVSGISFRKNEFLTSQGIHVGEAKEFVIRYKENITNKDVIVYKNKTYSIYSIFPLDEEDEFLLITAIIYQ